MERTVKPTNFDSARIEDLALLLGEAYYIYNQAGRADVARLITEMGGETRVDNFWAARQPLIVDGENSFVISVESAQSVNHDRFYSARLLGHLSLHMDSIDGFRPTVFPPTLGKKAGRAGIEATVFAHGLVMPKQRFETAYFKHEADVDDLVHVFDIGSTIVKQRCQMLKLAPAT